MDERISESLIEQKIAHHISEVCYDDLPSEAVQATKEHILHTIATVLAGSTAPGCATFMGVLGELGGTPESSVLGWGMRFPAHHAAMANSLMGHAQDFDNNDDRIAYKTSVCAVPSALAVAERLGVVHGRDLIAAACTGIDLGIRMGLAILPQPAHPTANMLGPFASATAAAKLLRLDSSAVWDALGLAMCGVSPAGVSTGGLSYSKRYLVGAASRNGVMAALLAARGFHARRAIFSGVENYYRIIHGRDGAVDILLDKLGECFEVVNVGPKPFPSCRYTHGPVEAALLMTLERNLRPEDVREIRVTVGPRDYEIVFGGDGGLASKQEPRSVVDAQFSEERDQQLRRYWTNASRDCALKPRCTTGKERRITRWEHEHVLEAAQKRLDQNPRAMRVRRETVEHPFGTLKMRMGATHFLMKRLPKVATEMALHVLAYNVTRVMNIVGIQPLIAAIRV